MRHDQVHVNRRDWTTIWRSSNGEPFFVGDMDSEHIFNAARMLWNHHGGDPQINGGRRYTDVPEWGKKYVKAAGKAFLAELERRGDDKVKLFHQTIQMKNTLIRVGKSKSIQTLVQEILFKAGASWGGSNKTVRALPGSYDTLGVENGQIYQGNYRDFGSSWRTFKQFDAETDLSGLVKFLDEPTEVRVKLNESYTAIVGKTHTDVGGEKIPNTAILAVAEAIEGK